MEPEKGTADGKFVDDDDIEILIEDEIHFCKRCKSPIAPSEWEMGFKNQCRLCLSKDALKYNFDAADGNNQNIGQEDREYCSPTPEFVS
mmetsp:Transcript_20306/g.17554  ORF Transcript_20306/g.17554 Transcript_20306/m.17554 type:complete len:89 (+) Transcript_20306:3337-3603(+)